MDVTDKALLEAIISTLARNTGQGRGYWRRRINGFQFHEMSKGICNWKLVTNGTPEEVMTIDQIVEALQAEYPIAVPA
jgi:hypothetical protein